MTTATPAVEDHATDWTILVLLLDPKETCPGPPTSFPARSETGSTYLTVSSGWSARA